MKRLFAILFLAAFFSSATAQRHCIVTCSNWSYTFPNFSCDISDADFKGNFPTGVAIDDTLFVEAGTDDVQRFVITSAASAANGKITATGVIVDDYGAPSTGAFALIAAKNQRLLNIEAAPAFFRQSLLKWFYYRDYNPDSIHPSKIEGGGDMDDLLRWNGSLWFSGKAGTGSIADGAVTSAKLAAGLVPPNNVIDAGNLTATTHNWNPSGLSGARGISVAVTATDYPEITGIVVPVAAKFNALTIYNRGGKIAVLSSEHSGSTASNRFAFENDFIELLPGGKVDLWYDAYASRWRADVLPSVLSVNRNFYYDFANDRFGNTSITSMDKWTNNASGGSATFSSGSAGSAPYNHIFITVTSSGNRYALASSSAHYISDKSALLSTDALVHVSALSNGTDNMTWIFGLSQTLTPSSVNKGAFFYASFVGDVVAGVTLSTTNWHCVLTQGGSSATVYDTGIAPATTAATAQLLQVYYGSWGARFYVNGTLVNAPTANTNFAATQQIICGGEKRAGTTAVTMSIFRVAYKFLDNF